MEGAARAGGGAAAPGRRELRQRLLRRRPRHRRRPGRPDAAGRQQGASPRAVKTAALLALGGAAAVGLVLAATTAWWLVGVGLLCILAAWFYTGGSRPYGYLGLGEVMVFVFFGLVAVLGTTYVQTETFELSALYAAIGVGAFACAILVANNLRDIPTDTVSGKRTLAVALGDERTRHLYGLLIDAAVVAAGRGGAEHHLVGAARARRGPRRRCAR